MQLALFIIMPHKSHPIVKEKAQACHNIATFLPHRQLVLCGLKSPCQNIVAGNAFEQISWQDRIT